MLRRVSSAVHLTMILNVLVLIVLITVGPGSYVHAGTFNLTNSTGGPQTYDVMGNADGNGFFDTVTLTASNSRQYGGTGGFGSTEGKETTNVKVMRTQGADPATLFFPNPEGPLQTARVLADLRGVSDVFSFFNFGAPGFTQLVANANFDFVGFEGQGIPVLLLAGTDVRMTDATGQLLPQFQFTEPTKVVGDVSNVPEPTTLLLWATAAGLGLAARWRRRKRNEQP